MRTRSALVALLIATSAAFAQPTSQPGESYPALRAKLAELTALVDRLKAENADLRERLTKAMAALPSDRNDVAKQEEVKPRWTFTIRFADYLKNDNGFFYRTKKEKQEQVDIAKRLDDAIAKIESTPEIRTALYEGRVIPGMTQSHVGLIAFSKFDYVRTANSESYLCTLWSIGPGSSWPTKRIQTQNGVVTVVADQF